MRKKVLLITPPYHAGVVESAGRWPNLGFVYIAGHLRAAGFEVEIYDAMTRGDDLESVGKLLADHRPHYVGTSAITASYPAALEVLRLAKGLNPRVITLLGGVHPTMMYTQVLEENPGVVDFVIRGEGEVTTVELLQALESGSPLDGVLGMAYLERTEGSHRRRASQALEGVPGIARLDKGCTEGAESRQVDVSAGQVVATAPRPFIQDLDSLLPAWDLVNWSDYTLFVRPGSRLGIVSSSRGCVNACRFCSQQKFWHRSYRQRSPESFVQELEHLRDSYGVTVVMLSDEYPTRDRQRWERILHLLSERRVGMDLLLETCVADILRDADILERYHQAGVRHIYVGVEATSNQRLEIFQKDIKCEESREALRLINEAGIITECSFVLGLPDETPERIAETLALAKYYDPDFAHFLHLAPWPYADLYQEVRGFIVEEDYSKYNFVEPILQPEAMALAEMKQTIIDCYREFYLDKARSYRAGPDGFKKEYFFRSLQVMLKNSFLKKHLAGLGKMPREVETLLAPLPVKGVDDG
ncbi:MAG: cobalamin-dependent protein [Firmicutes bacterium]|nr:cobalamin-dependent protein [Bacillota bacterium]